MKTKSILIGLTLLASLANPAWCQDRPDRDHPERDRPQRDHPERDRLQRDQPERDRLRTDDAARTRDSADAQWRIGVMIDPLGDLLRQHLQLPEGTGVLADRVIEGSPAARAGLKAGNIILSAGKKPVGDLDTLKAAVTASAKTGKPLVLWVLQEGKKQEIRIAPPARPDNRVRRNPEARKGAQPVERMTRALREMRAQLEKQGNAIERLEKRIDEMSRRRPRD